MNHLSIPALVLRRLTGNWRLLATIFVSIAFATTVAAAAPVYLKALERLALNLAIDRLTRLSSNVNVVSRNVLLTPDEFRHTEQSVADAIDQHISAMYERRERYLTVGTYLAGTPSNPLPPPGESNRIASRASLRSYSNLEHHVTFLEGRMASSAVGSGSQGPMFEAVISPTTAGMLQVRVGDTITLAPDPGHRARISARIVGIMEATNATGDYWLTHASIFIDPPPPEESPGGGEVQYDPEQPPAPLLITQEAMVEAVGRTYPGTLVNSSWYIQVNTERLKDWSASEVRNRLEDFESDLQRAMPVTEVFTGITRVLNEFERSSFFSRVPLLLLLVVTVATILFYLSMMVSYLVRSREGDVSLMRSRGAGTLKLLRLYALEGLIMTTVAVALAPLLAIGIVAIAGKLPYFREMTGGDLLPVVIGPTPFLVAVGAGALCLLIFVIPSILGARGGLLTHKLRSSRPPTTPLFHRYYVDVALLSLGGLTFWELHSRGHIISGGLFKDVEVNEALLLAPFLFLIVVALIFMRLFPLLVRFIGGESPALLHLLTAATGLTLVSGMVARNVQESNGLSSLGPAALLLAAGGVYWATFHAQRTRHLSAGLILQAGLVGWFLALEPPAPGQALFVPTIALIFIVPAQWIFLLLRASARTAPAWISVGLWHMARNPLQHVWLILLLVLVTGVGILSTTVGGTLDRSREDRVRYDVAADIRLTDIQSHLAGGTRAIKDRYLKIPGVTAVSPALRLTGTAGPTSFETLGLESREFSYISWYRKDFSDSSFGDVMGALQSHPRVERVAIPDGATTIAVWVRPEESYSSLSLWMVIEDGAGAMTTLSLGVLGPPEWHLMKSDIPSRLEGPLHLVSVQIFEPGFGPVGTPGSLLLDDIHVEIGPDGEEHVVEDFEGRRRWTPIVTSPISSDSVSITTSGAHMGTRAGVFSFGKETVQGIRGFYHSPTGGFVPIVASSAFVTATGARVGDTFIAEIAGRPVPVVIRETAHYFPTMKSSGGRFILADLDDLMGHLNVLGQLNPLSPASPFTPNELLLTQEPTADQAVREAVSALVQSREQIHDREEQLESSRMDPLTTAGWRSMVLLSLTVVVLAAALGYGTNLLSSANRRRGEMGFLQSMGFSRRQLLGMLGFEHLTIAVSGLGLGTWAGYQMSRLMVSSIAVTEDGQPVVPPFVLTTDWGTLLPTYAALIGIFLAGLFMLNRSIGRLDLQAISRAEGI